MIETSKKKEFSPAQWTVLNQIDDDLKHHYDYLSEEERYDFLMRITNPKFSEERLEHLLNSVRKDIPLHRLEKIAALDAFGEPGFTVQQTDLLCYLAENENCSDRYFELATRLDKNGKSVYEAPYILNMSCICGIFDVEKVEYIFRLNKFEKPIFSERATDRITTSLAYKKFDMGTIQTIYADNEEEEPVFSDGQITAMLYIGKNLVAASGKKEVDIGEVILKVAATDEYGTPLFSALRMNQFLKLTPTAWRDIGDIVTAVNSEGAVYDAEQISIIAEARKQGMDIDAIRSISQVDEHDMPIFDGRTMERLTAVYNHEKHEIIERGAFKEALDKELAVYALRNAAKVYSVR